MNIAKIIKVRKDLEELEREEREEDERLEAFRRIEEELEKREKRGKECFSVGGDYPNLWICYLIGKKGSSFANWLGYEDRMVYRL